MRGAARLARGVGCGLTLALVVTGCFARVQDLPRAAAPAFAPLPEADPDLLVGVAISGGGSRAATFAAAVLEALARVRVPDDAGGERSLLERVHYMSSVSGGSLATGYFAARKPPRAQPVLGPGPATLSPAYEEFFREYKAAMQENFEWPAAWHSIPPRPRSRWPRCGTPASSTT